MIERPPADGAAGDRALFDVFRLPTEVRFGVGAAGTLASTIDKLGRRVVVCSDPVIAATDHFRDLVEELGRRGLLVGTISDVAAELPVTQVEAAARAARDLEPDVVVGFGGGSSIDLAKAVALLVTYPGSASDYYGENAVPGPTMPIVAVPTTAGTGSEVTPVAVLSDPERALKVGVSSPFLIPDLAVVDPELTIGAPPSVTAHAGIDALAHAIESFTCRRRTIGWSQPTGVFVGRNDLSSYLALQATGLITASLQAAVANGSDLRARTAMSQGSLLAGMAFGTAGTHLAHAIQYPVGAITHSPHGLGTGMLLPYVLEACEPAIRAELGLLAEAAGVTDGTASGLIGLVRDLGASIGLPQSLSDLGVERRELPRIVELALTVRRLVGNAPVAVEPRLIDEIVRAAFEGRSARAVVSPSAVGGN